MTFHFSAYSTPLLFGFVQGWLYAILLWVRGGREERLSDKLLGWVLVALCFQIWIYMLGFGGIELFWRQLDFFPRTLSFLLPPLIYFYLKSQLDFSFQFRRHDAWHALPFVVHWTYHLIVFVQGPDFVRYWQPNVHDQGVDDLEFVSGTVQQYLYIYWSFKLYRGYRQWSEQQFSETETTSFRWYRNFLIALTATLTFNLFLTLIDLWLNLSFWQDWWGNLVGVVLIYYVSIEGYAQVQVSRRLTFRAETAADSVALEPLTVPLPEVMTTAYVADVPARRRATNPVRSGISVTEVADRLIQVRSCMEQERPHLTPDLSLPDLARRLQISPALLSQVINVGAGKNFNDFVNEYRVDEFKRQARDPANVHLSLLGIALNCGFNSKATFNRAFRKCTGTSPKEFAIT